MPASAYAIAGQTDNVENKSRKLVHTADDSLKRKKADKRPFNQAGQVR